MSEQITELIRVNAKIHRLQNEIESQIQRVQDKLGLLHKSEHTKYLPVLNELKRLQREAQVIQSKEFLS